MQELNGIHQMEIVYNDIAPPSEDGEEAVKITCVSLGYLLKSRFIKALYLKS